MKRAFLLFLTFFSFTLYTTNNRLISFEEYLKRQNYETWVPSFFVSSEIHLYQKTLLTLGYDPGPIDGILGPKTIKAIKKFQRDNKLVPDGIVGNKTREALFSNTLPIIRFSNGNLSNSVKSNYRVQSFSSHTIKSLVNSQKYVIDYKGRLVPFHAENGSYYGQISKGTGRPKVVHVRGYYRKDGTYVRGHYRSRPRR